jgi:membrane associated rhomboid family serine protease
LVIPFLVLLALAVGYNLQLRSGIDPSAFGLHPRDSKQWWGIFTSSFVHGSLEHLMSNMIALGGLLSLLFVFYDKVAVWILIGAWVFTGSIMYFFARPVFFHIGASGVAYAISFYLLISGFISNDRNLRIISLIVSLYYGSMIWGLFPLDPKVSWDGHAAGAIAGLLLSIITFRKYRVKKTILLEGADDWNEDEIDEYQQFDNRESDR